MEDQIMNQETQLDLWAEQPAADAVAASCCVTSAGTGGTVSTPLGTASSVACAGCVC